MPAPARSRWIFPWLVALILAPLPLACTDRADLRLRARGPRQIRVAAVQYARGASGRVAPDCAEAESPDNCAVHRLVERAARRGALLVVTPEYALDQSAPEPEPRVGHAPGESPAGRRTLLGAFGRQAARLEIYLVLNLLTASGTGSQRRTYNTQVAFGPDGVVRAVHHKITLYDDEARTLTPGREVTAFHTPFGTVGLLVCADLYGDLRHHRRLVRQKGASLIAVSSAWTAAGAARWPRSFARNWGVHVVTANTTAGPGVGGGVFDPDGRPLAERSVPGLATAWIRLP